MNNRVIIINGGIGSGKSTLREIASNYFNDKLGKTASLDLDDLYKILDPKFSALGNNLSNNWIIARTSLAVLTDFYFENEVNCVFVVGPFFTNEEVEFYTKFIKSEYELFLFTLKPSDEVMKLRILKRGDKEKDEIWINNYLKNLEQYYKNNMDIIDNSNLSPEETLNKIINRVQI